MKRKHMRRHVTGRTGPRGRPDHVLEHEPLALTELGRRVLAAARELHDDPAAGEDQSRAARVSPAEARNRRNPSE